MRTTLRSFAALSASLYLAGSSLAAAECPETFARSCSADTSSETLNPDACCAPTDGGLFKYTQEWSPDTNRWTLNDFQVFSCDGKTQQRFCDLQRQHTVEGLTDLMRAYKGGFTEEWNRLGQIIDTMGWPGQEIGLGLVSIWAQMWGEHATCISTLAATCTGSEGDSIADFIASIPKTHEQLNTTAFFADASVIPSDDPAQTYTRSAIVDALQKGSNVHVTTICEKKYLKKVVYTYGVEGRYQDAKLRQIESYTSSEKESCPEEGIRYQAPVVPDYTDEEVEEALRILKPPTPVEGDAETVVEEPVWEKGQAEESSSEAEPVETETVHVKDEL